MLTNQSTTTWQQPKNGNKTNNKSPYGPVILGTQKISRFLSTSQLMHIMLLVMAPSKMKAM
jgi:hypothetical protein